MEQLALYSGTLGLSPPWQVTEVTFAKDSNRLDIRVAYEPLTPPACPVCGTQAADCQADSQDETWFHEDFFHYATYLHARVPQPPCKCGLFPRPWCRAGSRFTKIP
jgi:transposase